MIIQQDLSEEYLIGFVDFLRWMDGYIFLAFILIIADLFFGTQAAKKRGEKVRRSRALRRSIDKICSYVLWLVVAYSLGEVFDKPIDSLMGGLLGEFKLPTIMLMIIYFIELESVFKNYFEWRGIKAKINLLNLFSKKTKIIEIEEDKDKKDE